jgi:hypothetical protein
MRKLICFLIIIPLCAFLSGCTQQQVARQYGGSAKIDLPACKKLVMVTWKESNLWVLTRDMHEGEKTETYQFKEDSSWGLMQGTVTIQEYRSSACPAPQK